MNNQLPVGWPEARLRRRGFRVIAGADEAGRGALAGPLVAAAVILDPQDVPNGLRDSKLLTARQRDVLFDEICDRAVSVGVHRVSKKRLDRIGLQAANIRALQAAIRKLDPAPDFTLVDGLFRLHLRMPSLRVIKGDMISASVAAASIVAKVTRDRTMIRLHRRHPEYGFDQNKGYAAAEHREALDELGPCEAHRLCFPSIAQTRLDLDFGDVGNEAVSAADPAWAEAG